MAHLVRRTGPLWQRAVCPGLSLKRVRTSHVSLWSRTLSSAATRASAPLTDSEDEPAQSTPTKPGMYDSAAFNKMMNRLQQAPLSSSELEDIKEVDEEGGRGGKAVAARMWQGPGAGKAGTDAAGRKAGQSDEAQVRQLEGLVRELHGVTRDLQDIAGVTQEVLFALAELRKDQFDQLSAEDRALCSSQTRILTLPKKDAVALLSRIYALGVRPTGLSNLDDLDTEDLLKLSLTEAASEAESVMYESGGGGRTGSRLLAHEHMVEAREALKQAKELETLTTPMQRQLADLQREKQKESQAADGLVDTEDEVAVTERFKKVFVDLFLQAPGQGAAAAELEANQREATAAQERAQFETPADTEFRMEFDRLNAELLKNENVLNLDLSEAYPTPAVAKAISYANASRPQLLAGKKRQIVKEFGYHEFDTGSSSVQVAILTERINILQHEHFKTHRGDKTARRGLRDLIVKRQQFMNHLRRTDYPKFVETMTKLGLPMPLVEERKPHQRTQPKPGFELPKMRPPPKRINPMLVHFENEAKQAAGRGQLEGNKAAASSSQGKAAAAASSS